jgi:amino acid transporter
VTRAAPREVDLHTPSTVKRSLGLFDAICLGLNAIVGSGIFLLPDDLYRQMGAWSPLAFALCALGLLPVASCYAKAAALVEHTGGPYVYAREAFGARAGFVVGWMCFANSLFSFAAVASAAAAYSLKLWPTLASASGSGALAALVVIAFGTLNYFGAKPAVRAIDMFTFGKFLVLLILVAVLIPHASAARFASAAPPTLAGVGAATFMALFALQGFEVVPVPAAETRAPKRNLPRAVLISLSVAALLYTLVQSVLVAACDGLGRESDAPLADAALALAPTLGIVVTLGGLISTLGFVSGSAFGTPRYLFAAANHGHLPGALGRVHPRFATPHAAIATTAALAAVLCLPFDYRTLIGMSNVAVSIQYLATCLALPRLTAASGRPSAGLRTMSLVGAAVSLSICTQASLVELGWAAGSLLVGLGIEQITRKLKPVGVC